jgi:hypothetical protein
MELLLNLVSSSFLQLHHPKYLQRSLSSVIGFIHGDRKEPGISKVQLKPLLKPQKFSHSGRG